MTERECVRRGRITWKEYAHQTQLSKPIQPTEIADFQGWLNVNGYRSLADRDTHLGFDFTAYRTSQSIEVGLVGKNVRTENNVVNVYAIESGQVERAGGYHASQYYLGHIVLVHNGDFGWLISRYTHVVPESWVRIGEKVEKGQKIGRLFTRIKAESIFPHLHLTLFEEDDPFHRSSDYYTPDIFKVMYGDPHWQRARYVDPIDVFPELKTAPRVSEEELKQISALADRHLEINFNK